MTTAAMLRRGGAMTLFVYGCHTLIAALLAEPLSADLAAVLSASAPSQLNVAVLAEVVARRAPQLLYRAIEWGGAYALLAPLSTVIWLDAMAGAAGVRKSLSRGLRRYPAALALFALALLGHGATLALCALTLHYCPTILPASEIAEGALFTVTLSATASAALVIATVHDVARAALASGASNVWSALVLSARCLSHPILARHLLLIVGSALSMVLAEGLGRLLHAAPSVVLLLAPQQTLVFGAVCLRGAWLAQALKATAAATPH
jgi:hypothetical protein